MVMRIGDLDALEAKFIELGNIITSYDGAASSAYVVNKAPAIDPVHAAGGCYCQECVRWEPDGSYGLDLDGVRHPYGACNATHCFSRDDHFCGHGRQKETQK